MSRPLSFSSQSVDAMRRLKRAISGGLKLNEKEIKIPVDVCSAQIDLLSYANKYGTGCEGMKMIALPDGTTITDQKFMTKVRDSKNKNYGSRAGTWSQTGKDTLQFHPKGRGFGANGGDEATLTVKTHAPSKMECMLKYILEGDEDALDNPGSKSKEEIVDVNDPDTAETAIIKKRVRQLYGLQLLRQTQMDFIDVPETTTSERGVDQTTEQESRDLAMMQSFKLIDDLDSSYFDTTLERAMKTWARKKTGWIATMKTTMKLVECAAMAYGGAFPPDCIKLLSDIRRRQTATKGSSATAVVRSQMEFMGQLLDEVREQIDRCRLFDDIEIPEIVHIALAESTCLMSLFSEYFEFRDYHANGLLVDGEVVKYKLTLTHATTASHNRILYVCSLVLSLDHAVIITPFFSSHHPTHTSNVQRRKRHTFQTIDFCKRTGDVRGDVQAHRKQQALVDVHHSAAYHHDGDCWTQENGCR